MAKQRFYPKGHIKGFSPKGGYREIIFQLAGYVLSESPTIVKGVKNVVKRLIDRPFYFSEYKRYLKAYSLSDAEKKFRLTCKSVYSSKPGICSILDTDQKTLKTFQEFENAVEAALSELGIASAVTYSHEGEKPCLTIGFTKKLKPLKGKSIEETCKLIFEPLVEVLGGEWTMRLESDKKVVVRIIRDPLKRGPLEQ